jgi:AbrB family looped-hinge helix DNA binding protein
MKTVVSKTGAIRIPAELRKKYNLTAGSEVVIIDYGGVLSIVPAAKDPIKQGYGFLKGSHTQAIMEEHAKDREREEAKFKRFFHDE